MMNSKKLVVIAPHPDDETLGCGGTIARFAASGTEVSVLVVSGHLPPLYDQRAFETTHREALAAFEIMGVARSEFLKIPATLVRDGENGFTHIRLGNSLEGYVPDEDVEAI